MKRLSTATALAWTAVAAGSSLPTAAAGQEVTSADLTVSVADGWGAGEVVVRYTLSGATELDAVPVELLGLTEGPPPTVTDGLQRIVALAAESGSRLTGLVSLDGTEGALTLRYDVGGATSVEGASARIRVPILTVSLPPATGGQDIFTADVSLPSGWVATESFPSGLRVDDGGTLRATLPVVPSLISIHARTDGVWRPGLDLVLELLGGVVLVAFTVAGHRHLTRARGDG